MMPVTRSAGSYNTVGVGSRATSRCSTYLAEACRRSDCLAAPDTCHMSRSGALLETTLEYVDSVGVRTLTTLGQVDETRLSRGRPVRTIRSHKNQRHRPGLLWSATTGGHVPYESQLELARLWFADFDPEIVWIIAQPMWLVGWDERVLRRHFPDFLLVRSDGGLIVVDVKPRVFATKPKADQSLHQSQCGSSQPETPLDSPRHSKRHHLPR